MFLCYSFDKNKKDKTMIDIGITQKPILKIFQGLHKYSLSPEQIAEGIYITATSGSGKQHLMETILFNGQKSDYKFLVIGSHGLHTFTRYCSIAELDHRKKIQIILDKETVKDKMDYNEHLEDFQENDIKYDLIFYTYNSVCKTDNIKDKIKRLVDSHPEHIVVYLDVNPDYIVDKQSNIIISNVRTQHKLKTELFMRTECDDNFENTCLSQKEIDTIMSFPEGVFIDLKNPHEIFDVIYIKEVLKENALEDISVIQI